MRYWMPVLMLALTACSSPAPTTTGDAAGDASDTADATEVADAADGAEIDATDSGTATRDTGPDMDGLRAPDDGCLGLCPDADAGLSDDGSGEVDGAGGGDVADACECSDASKPCCDGCHFRPEGYRCGPVRGGGSGCAEGDLLKCGGTKITVEKYRGCTGNASICPEEPEKHVVDRRDCMPNQVCRAGRCERDARRCG